VQTATIPAMNPVRPPLANGTTSVCSCRPQDHEDPVPALNLQLIQYNLGAFRQQCPLSHSELRGIARSCPSSTPNPSAGKVPTLVCQYQLKIRILLNEKSPTWLAVTVYSFSRLDENGAGW
jgi:hypothetical protein